jgi:tetratricopeptide (TPR) repeat protein
MSILGRILGKPSNPEPGKRPGAMTLKQSAPPLTAALPEERKVDVYDSFGRQVSLTLDRWRSLIFEPTLKAAWNQPDELAACVSRSMQDGLTTEALPASARLLELEPRVPRAVALHAAVLRSLKRFDEAQSLLEKHLEGEGDSLAALLGLLQVFLAKENNQEARPIVSRILLLDPNNSLAYRTFIDAARRDAGASGEQQAIYRIATLPNSWRARLWIAKRQLDEGDLEAALQTYDEALNMTARPVPEDFLMGMTGDLGMHNHAAEMVALGEPLFDPMHHGLNVGNNLMKANLDLGNLRRTRELLDSLYALAQPAWQSQLVRWEEALVKAAAERYISPTDTAPEVGFAAFPRVLWLKTDSDEERAFLGDALSERPSVVIFTASCAQEGGAEFDQQQTAHIGGLISRSLPVYLTERLASGRIADPYLLVPWMMKPRPGLVLINQPWNLEAIVMHAKQANPKATWAIAPHITYASGRWQVTLQVIELESSRIVTTITQEIELKTPKPSFESIADQVVSFYEAALGTTRHPPEFYQAPQNEWFGDYLMRIDDLIRCRCFGPEGVESNDIFGHRAMLEASLRQCLAAPDNATVRAFFIAMFSAVRRSRRGVSIEYERYLGRLQSQHPLNEQLQGPFNRRVEEILAMPATEPNPSQPTVAQVTGENQ